VELWVKQVAEAESCNFPTEDIIDAQNFNFSEISAKWGFWAHILYFWTSIFRQEENFRTKYNLGKGGQYHVWPLPRRH